MGRGVWRRGAWHRALIAATCAGMAAIAVPAAAGPPTEVPFTGTGISCYALEEGELVLDLGAIFTAEGAVDSGFGFAQVGDSGLFAPLAEGGLDAGAFVLSFTFLDEQGDPAGTLDLFGTASPEGEAVDVSSRWREGNVRGTVTGTVRELEVTGKIDTATGQLAGLVGTDLVCDGQDLDLVETSTNPATRIQHTVGSSGSCEVGEAGYLNVELWGDQAFASLELIDPQGGDTELLAAGEVVYSAPSITGVLDVVVPRGTDQSVSLDLTVGDLLERGRVWDKWASGAFSSHYVRYELSGAAVLLPDDEELALRNCVFSEYRMTERFSSRAGQKPGGRAPVNDLPGNALPIGPASTEKVSTRGAAEAPEVPCTLSFEGESWEAPFGRTVWYAFEGTGDPVTLTTAGSGFDTVMGVYADTMQQEACVDDVVDGDQPSLEAAVTVDTEEGATYLVQVGGFAFEPNNPVFGTVVLTRR